MKLLAISDKIEDSFLNTGLSMPKLKGVELILACGDLPPSYMEYMVSALNVPLYYVLGNHDQKLYKQHINGCICLDETTIVFKNRIIGGLSGSIKYADDKLMYSEMQMHGKIAGLFPHLLYNRIRHKRYIDILITHFHGHTMVGTIDRDNTFNTCYNSTQIINVNHYRILEI